MLRVKTKLAPSTIEGLGLFADQDISKGALIWEFTPGIDLEITPETLGSLTGPGVKRLISYTYRCLTSGVYVLCADDARFMNHSENANTITLKENLRHPRTIAARNISRGEELTSDYTEFDEEHGQKLATV